MKIRFVMGTYLTHQRLEVLLAVLTPFFLIIESAMANAWVYAGGSLDFHDLRTYIALARGLFFEVMTFSCAKLARLLFAKGRRHSVGAVIATLVALWAIAVSTGNNLGWVLSGGDLGGMLAAVGHYLPHWFDEVYQLGLGVLLPLSVGALALVDVEHLVHAMLDSAHLDNKAMQVQESEMHRTEYLKAQHAQRSTIRQAYDEIAEQRTQKFIERVKQGNMDFGAQEVASGLPAGPVVRRLNAPGGASFVPSGLGGFAGQRPLMPPSATGPVLPGQVLPPPPFSQGNTQPIFVPPPSARQ